MAAEMLIDDVPTGGAEDVQLKARPWRLVVVLAVCGLLLLIVGGWFLTHGEPVVGLNTVWEAMQPSTSATTSPGVFLVRELRLPRLVLSIVAGAALGLAGVILQDSLRNPIADPGLLGVSEAASFVVAIVVVFPGSLPDVATPALCLIAGLLTGVLLVRLARSIRDPVRLILIGVVIASFFTTLSSLVLLLAPQGASLTTFFTYTTGSVASASWDRIAPVLPWVIVGVIAAMLCGRPLNLLQLGDDVASGLGLNVTRTRFILLAIAVLLVAPVVAVAGPIAFVAFLSPHIARLMLRSTNAHIVLPASAAIGAVIVVIADTLGRLLFFPLEIPAGIWTIVVAGPIALWMGGSVLRGSETESMS